MNTPDSKSECSPHERNVGLFNEIAQNIASQGYSIHANAIDTELLHLLSEHLGELPSSQFKRAGIGREDDHTVKDTIRGDEICWINGESKAEVTWLSWAASLQQYLNRRLFLGLFSFESHFAHYAPGDFYKKHQDAFDGEANRILSVVVYLNKQWRAEDGGELIVYSKETDDSLAKIIPGYGTLVIFLSEEFPHEVLPAIKDRYSIAGWFRVNTSNTARVDPPK